MVIDNFYLPLFGLVLILGLVKFAGRTPTTFPGSISLVGCFCVMETIHPIEGEGVQWGCLLGSSTVLLFTSLIYVGVLRKLDYTQKPVKEMNHKGWPKWLFSWISNPNSGPFPEKAFFDIMVRFLFVNLITVYYLIKMLYCIF